MLLQATGDRKYKVMYDELWEYCWAHFVDHEHGAWCVGHCPSREHHATDHQYLAKAALPRSSMGDGGSVVAVPLCSKRHPPLHQVPYP